MTTALEGRTQIQGLVGAVQDGRIGPITLAAIASCPPSVAEQVQMVLHVAEDGKIGTKSLSALHLLQTTPDDAQWPPSSQVVPSGDGWHSVKASSFADPADVAAFRRCKANGGSDLACFRVGDNGIGKWGDDCSEGSGPKCALPPEVWVAKFGAGAGARHAPVMIQANGRTVTALMDDTMPHESNITNGAGIDLSPDTVKALGLNPPIMVAAQWKWA